MGRSDGAGSRRSKHSVGARARPKAAAEQEERTAADPIFEDLEKHLGGLAGKILCADVRVILDVRNATQDHNVRIGSAMRALGWKRTIASFDGTKKSAYIKKEGKAQMETITVVRDKEGLFISSGDEDQPVLRREDVLPF